MEKEVSFVHQTNMRTVKSREELTRIINGSKKLSNCDLSQLDLESFDFSGFELVDVIFNYFDKDCRQRKLIFNVDFTDCKMTRVCFAQCKLERCNFDRKSRNSNTSDIKNVEADMDEVDFFFSELQYCRFKNLKIQVADFRYSILESCSLGFLDITYGDFYMTAFKGSTNFPDAKFRCCSLSYATFENHCMTMDNIDKLIQESYSEYNRIIIKKRTWIKQNPCAGKSCLNKTAEKDELTPEEILDSKIYIAKEAMLTYAQLSGIYNGKGLYKDSNKAYAKSKKNESFYYKLLMQRARNNGQIREWCRYLMERINPLMSGFFGYGYKVWPLLLISLVIILLFWLLLTHVGAHAASAGKGFVLSIANAMGPVTDKKDISEDIQIITVFESVLGVLLVGFLGFVFANKIRNNS